MAATHTHTAAKSVCAHTRGPGEDFALYYRAPPLATCHQLHASSCLSVVREQPHGVVVAAGCSHLPAALLDVDVSIRALLVG